MIDYLLLSTEEFQRHYQLPRHETLPRTYTQAPFTRPQTISKGSVSDVCGFSYTTVLLPVPRKETSSLTTRQSNAPICLFSVALASIDDLTLLP
jgi:hypothetical protein